MNVDLSWNYNLLWVSLTQMMLIYKYDMYNAR